MEGSLPLPSVAQPRERLKRKHGDMGTNGEVTEDHRRPSPAAFADGDVERQAVGNGYAASADSLDDAASDASSVFLDLLDTFELEPYKAGMSSHISTYDEGDAKCPPRRRRRWPDR